MLEACIERLPLEASDSDDVIDRRSVVGTDDVVVMDVVCAVDWCDNVVEEVGDACPLHQIHAFAAQKDCVLMEVLVSSIHASVEPGVQLGFHFPVGEAATAADGYLPADMTNANIQRDESSSAEFLDAPVAWYACGTADALGRDAAALDAESTMT
jgi:hypothetical protein